MAVKTPKLDPAIAAAVDLARDVALDAAGVMGVGEHVDCVVEDERVATHYFACPHPGYVGWRWAVTMARASRARTVTVDEVVLLPSAEALQAPAWVPWADRVQAGDVSPGMLMATPDNDPRLEPGYTGGEQAPDADPAEGTVTRAVVAELGLGRERVLSRFGREQAAERWMAAGNGPDNQLTKQAPGPCETCGYFVRLQGSMGVQFGACTNEYSPSDAQIVSVDHGCGAHSDVVADERGLELSLPIWDTIGIDENLFD